MQLLHVDSSITGTQSVSRQLTAEIVAKLRQVTPDLDITYRDLAASRCRICSGSILAARQPAAGQPSVEVEHDLVLSAKALDEFLAADIVVIGAPMYNFRRSKPAQGLDRLPCSFRQDIPLHGNGCGGSCGGGKRVIIASSRGGFYTGS